MIFIITGINGFVGPHLKNILTSKGHICVGIGTSDNDDVNYIKCDLTDRKKVDFILNYVKPDGIFHLASLTHPPTSFLKPSEYFDNNTKCSINLCNSIIDNNLDCILMECSTPEVYGICPVGVSIKEDFPLRPMNPYGVSKAASDMYVLERSRNTSLKAFITRSGSHTGPGRPSNYSISSDAYQIAKILLGQQEPIIKVGNLQSQRAVVDVRDIAYSYHLLMDKFMSGEIESGEIFHISGDVPCTMQTYLDKMIEMSNINVELMIDPKLYRPIDIPYQSLNNDKIKRLVDWKPLIPINTTLQDLIDYWRERLK